MEPSISISPTGANIAGNDKIDYKIKHSSKDNGETVLMRLREHIRRTPQETSDSHTEVSDAIIPLEQPSWNRQIEDEILQFANICIGDAETCETSAKRNDIVGKIIQSAIIISGAISVYIAASSTTSEIKEIIQAIQGGFSTAMAGIYALFGMGKKAAIQKHSAERLRALARKLRIQILSGDFTTQDPLKTLLSNEKIRSRIMKRSIN